MALHLLQALIFSLWAVLMLRLFRRALSAHQAVAMKKRRTAHGTPAPTKPMAVRVGAPS